MHQKTHSADPTQPQPLASAFVLDFSRFEHTKTLMRPLEGLSQRCLLSSQIPAILQDLETDAARLDKLGPISEAQEGCLMGFEGQFFESDIQPLCGTSLLVEVELSDSDSETPKLEPKVNIDKKGHVSLQEQMTVEPQDNVLA